MSDLRAGLADQSVTFAAWTTATGAPVTITSATAGLSLWYRRGVAGLKIPLTTGTTPAVNNLATLDAAHTDAGILVIEGAEHRFDLPDAAIAAGVLTVSWGGSATGITIDGGTANLIGQANSASDLTHLFGTLQTAGRDLATVLPATALNNAPVIATDGTLKVDVTNWKTATVPAMTGDAYAQINTKIPQVITMVQIGGTGAYYVEALNSAGAVISTYAGGDTTGVTELLIRVADNTTTLSGLTGSISTISVGLDTNTTAISGLAGSVSTVSVGLATNTTAVNGLAGDVSTVSVGLGANTTAVSGLSGNVSTLSGSVDDLSTAVTGLTGSVSTVSVGLDANTTAVSGLVENVSTVSVGLDANTTAISGLSGTVGVLSDAVGELGTPQQAGVAVTLPGLPPEGYGGEDFPDDYQQRGVAVTLPEEAPPGYGAIVVTSDVTNIITTD